MFSFILPFLIVYRAYITEVEIYQYFAEIAAKCGRSNLAGDDSTGQIYRRVNLSASELGGKINNFDLLSAKQDNLAGTIRRDKFVGKSICRRANLVGK